MRLKLTRNTKTYKLHGILCLRRYLHTSLLKTLSGLYFLFIAFSWFLTLLKQNAEGDAFSIVRRDIRNESAWKSSGTYAESGGMTPSMLHRMPETKRAELLSSFWQLSVMPNASRPHRHSYCDAYYQAALRNRTFTTVYNVFANDVTDALDDVTLISHLTVSRFFMLEKLLMRWRGPMSVALLVHDSEEDSFWQMMTSKLYQPHLQLHVVIDKEGYYPVNYLRNVALKGAMTDFVLLGDVDFMPVSSLTENLKRLIFGGIFKKAEKQAYVVPAFELMKSDSSPFPEMKDQLVQLWKRRKIRPFHHVLRHAHGATNYSHWRKATEIYQVTPKGNYEPYVIVPRCLCPLYYERFVGRGYNKVAHILELHKTGFTFHVLPHGYFLHLPHKKLIATKENFKCSLKTFKKFTKYLKKKIRSPDKRNLPNC